MKKYFLSILVLAITCIELHAQQRITGGSSINITAAPWQVLLKIGNEYACGGSIIAPNFILTAKHCIEGLSPGSVKVIAGITCKNEINSSNTFNVSRIIPHPDPEIDIALLQLSNNITYNNNRKAINYLSSIENSLYNTGNTVRVSGWGFLTPNGRVPANCLQAVDVNIISNQNASNALGETIDAHEMATTGVGSVRQGACHGDSGGPLSITGSNGPVLVGVVSWGRPNCIGNNANSPSVFVRVSSIRNWITSTILSISGPSLVLNSGSTYTLSGTNGAPVTWTYSSNLRMRSSSNTSITVESLSASAGTGWIQASVGGASLRVMKFGLASRLSQVYTEKH